MSRTNLGAPLALGNVQAAYLNSGLPGLEIAAPVIYEVTPITLDDDGLAAAQAVAGAGNLTLNGALVTSGVGVFDVPRAVQGVSSDAGDTTQTLTFYGTDKDGVAVVETITLNGTTPVPGKKAFKRITRIAVSAACTGNVKAGSTDILGLPVRVNSRNRLFTAYNGAQVTTGTFAAADANTATATTGDVRGTFLPASATDGSKVLTCFIFPTSYDTLASVNGVAQYGG